MNYDVKDNDEPNLRIIITLIWFFCCTIRSNEPICDDRQPLIKLHNAIKDLHCSIQR